MNGFSQKWQQDSQTLDPASYSSLPPARACTEMFASRSQSTWRRRSPSSFHFIRAKQSRERCWADLCKICASLCMTVQTCASFSSKPGLGQGLRCPGPQLVLHLLGHNAAFQKCSCPVPEKHLCLWLTTHLFLSYWLQHPIKVKDMFSCTDRNNSSASQSYWKEWLYYHMLAYLSPLSKDLGTCGCEVQRGES